MGVIPTKQIFDEYFGSRSGTAVETMRNQIDKPELYGYEIKIGKDLIDMNVDEMFGLVYELQKRSNAQNSQFMSAHYSYDQISTLLRGVFNYYNLHYPPVFNPWSDPRMKGRAAMERFSQGVEQLSFKVIQDIIDKMHADYDQDRADYIELILLCYYSGFRNAEEIVTTTTKMINHRDMSINLPGRTIHLTRRCYELFEKFSESKEMESEKITYSMVRWNDSYFKFVVRPKNADGMKYRSSTEMQNVINRNITSYINKQYEVRINYYSLYLLGFYDFMAKRYGEDKIRQIVTSFRNSEDITLLMSMANEYGVEMKNVSHLKRSLRPFIKYDK